MKRKTVIEQMDSATRQAETQALLAIYAEVRMDAEALDLLESKCRWEHMTVLGVLKTWGDPRTWPSYSKKGMP